jgi:hypothetical protein
MVKSYSPYRSYMYVQLVVNNTRYAHEHAHMVAGLIGVRECKCVSTGV